MKKRLLFSTIAILFMAGCASMQEAYVQQTCNENGGYTQGMNDAREGKPMSTYFGQECPTESRSAAITGYRNGYTAGLASTQTPANTGTQINVNIGGGEVASDKNFYCEAHAFTSTFAAWGATQLEARVNAKNKCMQQYHEMHCGDITCHHS